MPILEGFFSACGGIRAGSNRPVLTANFPVLAYGILGKGGLFAAPRDLTFWGRIKLPLITVQWPFAVLDLTEKSATLVMYSK